MLTLILIIFFLIYAFLESVGYGYYEIKINKNKPGGIIVIILAFIGLVFSLISYINF